ncbi:MAG: Rrf2 family transcriptional regulator [Burkholderiaceae bacterium]
MKLTSFTDYSLRVLIYLAVGSERRITIAEIAAAFEIPENHLTKVVHFLGKQGWVSTVRGKGGGMVLAKPAKDISVGKVVRDTEGAAMPAECFGPDESNCAIARYCRLKGVLAEAVSGFYAVLDHYTLADIARNKQALSSVLHFHRPASAGQAR